MAQFIRSILFVYFWEQLVLCWQMLLSHSVSDLELTSSPSTTSVVTITTLRVVEVVEEEVLQENTETGAVLTSINRLTKLLTCTVIILSTVWTGQLTSSALHPAASGTLQSPAPAWSWCPGASGTPVPDAPGRLWAGPTVPPERTPASGNLPTYWRTCSGFLRGCFLETLSNGEKRWRQRFIDSVESKLKMTKRC